MLHMCNRRYKSLRPKQGDFFGELALETHQSDYAEGVAAKGFLSCIEFSRDDCMKLLQVCA